MTSNNKLKMASKCNTMKIICTFVTVLAVGSAISLYNGNTEFCCMGKVYQISGNGTISCCGSDVLNANTDICCNEKLIKVDVDKTSKSGIASDNFGCCGDKSFNSKLQVCCNGKILDSTTLNSSSPVHCCKDTLYSEDTFLCCLDTLLPNDPSKRLGCCGSKVYDIEKELCCDNTVASITNDKSSCCSNVPMSPAKEICCDGSLYQREENKFATCCGKDLLTQLDSQICCIDTIVSRPTVAHWCCKKEIYNEDTHICCKGNVLEKLNATRCCGGEAFDDTSRICCDEQIKERISPDTQCCGQQVLENDGFKVCCNSNFVNVDDTAKKLCCV